MRTFFKFFLTPVLVLSQFTAHDSMYVISRARGQEPDANLLSLHVQLAMVAFVFMVATMIVPKWDKVMLPLVWGLLVAAFGVLFYVVS